MQQANAEDPQTHNPAPTPTFFRERPTNATIATTQAHTTTTTSAF